MSGTRTTDVALCLPGHRRLGAIWSDVQAAAQPLIAVETEAGLQAVSVFDLRCAIQDLVDPDSPVESLARPELRVDRESTAIAAMGGPDAPEALLTVPVDGPPRLVWRSVSPIRDAVVMAGGFGTRLRPLTDETPKPLLDVGGRPLLCRILDRLRTAGVRRVHLSVHYLAERIEQVVGDGAAFGLEVRYLREDQPLGTGAGLALLTDVSGPFLVMNGDILTELDLVAFARHHVAAGNLATVATWLHDHPLAYGVVRHRRDRDGQSRIEHIEEKPVYRYPVNAGIYAFAAATLDLVTPGAPLAMVDFLNDCAATHSVGRFPLLEYWNDVGSHADYARAQRDVESL